MSFDQIAPIVSVVANAVTAISAVVVAIAAWLGLRAWRRELTGKGRYEAVRRVLLLARRFRGAFGRSRGMFTWANEYADRPRGENETPAQRQILDEQYARLNRLRPAADLLAELEQAVWETEVVTGEELVPLAKPFGEVFQELNLAIVQHFHARIEVANGHPISVHIQEGERHTRLIYEPGEDDLTKRVDDALAELEKRLKKYIH